ncbi:hypothetical protein TRVL_05374 [Trypanosoma vivax]|nr:hypothetical protein TRVL_05374 [Trypanosoma vivax]
MEKNTSGARTEARAASRCSKEAVKKWKRKRQRQRSALKHSGGEATMKRLARGTPEGVARKTTNEAETQWTVGPWGDSAVQLPERARERRPEMELARNFSAAG